ncbi:MAG TPA: cytochrome C oxidase subunit IV family protein [Candidatus Acidoferrales bacterium]|nr:cytochrome C oxidase subunit IV family protein [Candidatus Acidoferrales bacterium]
MKAQTIVPVKVYAGTFVGLIALAALTTGLAYVHMGIWNTVAALTIAVAKMLLVILFFMHLRYDRGITRIVIIAGLLWLTILIVLTASDVFTRSWSPIPAGWGPAISVQQKQ